MIRRQMTAFVAFLVVGLCASTFAQDYSYHAYKFHKERYEQTLAQLLDAARADLGIEIAVDANAKPFLEEKVPMAPWKFWSDPNLRLAYILAPLDLTFEKTGENSYRVFEPWYQNRPESEGAAALQRSLKNYPDLESWQKRRAEIKSAILDTFGLNPLPKKTPFNPIETQTYQFDGYNVKHVALEVFPKYWLCGSLYRPAEESTPSPIVLCPHGHGVDGRLDENCQYRCATLARMGAVVFSYSMFAWIPEESPLTKEAHRDPIAGAIQTYDTIRAVDYVTSLENVDASRIAITGESGGGSQTFYGTAVEDRITVAVPVVMVSSHFFGGCPCESGTPVHTKCGGFCNVDVAALAAPRPMKLIAITQDWTKNTPEVEYPYIKTIYGYFDAQDSVEYEIFDEPHNYGKTKRDSMYPFIAKQFGLDMSKVDESKVTIEPRAEMLPFGANREKYPEDAVKTLDELKAAFEAAKTAE